MWDWGTSWSFDGLRMRSTGGMGDVQEICLPVIVSAGRAPHPCPLPTRGRETMNRDIGAVVGFRNGEDLRREANDAAGGREMLALVGRALPDKRKGRALALP